MWALTDTAPRGAQHKEALADAEVCIKLAPDFSKGYSRKAFALYKQGLFTEAMHTCDAGLEVDPDNESLKSTRTSAEAGRMAWSRHTQAGPTESTIPQWLGSLLAPVRAVLLYFAFLSSGGNAAEWQVFLQVAMAEFGLSMLPDLLARNWRGCMQGSAAHYLAFSALLYFSDIGAFLPGSAMIVLVNIPEFFRADLGGMLQGSSYGAAVMNFARATVWAQLIGAAEIAVGVLVIYMAISNTDKYLFFGIFYWQWLRIRCMLGTNTKQSFEAIDRIVGPMLGKIPVISTLYNTVKRIAAYAAQVPEPGEKPRYNPCSIM